MGKFVRTNTLENRSEKRGQEEYWKIAIAQAMTSGGSIVVFLPKEKKLLIE